MLFSTTDLERLLNLHQKSYAVLKWVNGALEAGKLSFSVVHEATSTAHAAEEWLRRHYENLPREHRPTMDELPAFSHLFASYLTTSFRLPDQPVAKRIGFCCCECCSYLSYAHRLVPVDPNAKDQSQAHRLKALCLRALGETVGIAVTPAQEAAVLGDKTLSFELAHVSYAFELLRRTEYASQGTGVLSLWRTIAWEGGRPRRKWRLTADRVVQAEARVFEALKAAGA